MDPGFRAEVKKGHATLSLTGLASQVQLSGLGPLNLGDSQADLVYTPLTPCRLFDTRISQGGAGPIPAGGTRNFVVAGLCGVPVGPATAAVINFVAVNPAGPGDLRVTPFGTPMPASSIINYAAVPGLNIANGPAIKICDPATTACTSDITIQADVSATDVLGDVQGYFRKVPKEQVKSTHVVSRTPFTTSVGTTCTNYASGVITVTAPVAGKIAVRANVAIRLNHVIGALSQVDVYVGTTPTDCSSLVGYAEYAFMPSAAATGFYEFWLHPSREDAVAAGTHTYYINGTRGGGAHNFWWGALEATFIPN